MQYRGTFLCLLVLWLKIDLAHLQGGSIEAVCRVCGDVVNEYCCTYYKSCCDFLNPSGCPTPSSPEARVTCRKPVRCRTNADCPKFKQCCDTAVCGATCMKPVGDMSFFTGYRYK